jgi:hypothetical protein
MISLLGNIGSVVKGVLSSPKFGDIVGLLGNITKGMGDYQSSQFGSDAEDAVYGINQAYNGQLMARRVRDMVGGATESYGHGLLDSVRAGGTMPNFTSSMWQRVSDGMEDYGADLRAMALNAKLRQASFAAQHGKNRMALLSSIVDGILNANNAVSSRVPKGAASTPGSSSFSGAWKGASGSRFSMPGRKRKGGR